MITSGQIKDFRTGAIDYQKTVSLKEKINKLKQARSPFFLTLSEFDEILRWKLVNQYVRQIKYRELNTGGLVQQITKFGLNITHQDKEYELELRINILTALRGVGVPVASAILALVYPESYCAIDYRGWRQVFEQEKNSFSISDYKKYLAEIKKLASELDWQIQEIDHAIWEYDRRHGK